MESELLPCWRCSAPATRSSLGTPGKYAITKYHCSEECGAFACTQEDWQANAKPAHELRQRAEKAEAEVALAYESMGAQVDDWKASALRNKAEVERLREALRFYAECKHIKSREDVDVLREFISDRGDVARKALEGGE